MNSFNTTPQQTKLFYIDGPGGSGKTYVYNTLIYTVLSQNKKVIATSWTGIAASLLHNGKTSHISFGLPLEINETTALRVLPGSGLYQKVIECDLLIWDEITLVHKHGFRAVDQLFRDVTGLNVPFGGKVVVIGGDWRQCLPIVREGHRTDTIEATIKAGNLWKKFTKLSKCYSNL
jgi:archaellum biogenesis ATPase FlaH